MVIEGFEMEMIQYRIQSLVEQTIGTFLADHKMTSEGTSTPTGQARVWTMAITTIATIITITLPSHRQCHRHRHRYHHHHNFHYYRHITTPATISPSSLPLPSPSPCPTPIVVIFRTLQKPKHLCLLLALNGGKPWIRTQAIRTSGTNTLVKPSGHIDDSFVHHHHHHHHYHHHHLHYHLHHHCQVARFPEYITYSVRH